MIIESEHIKLYETEITTVENAEFKDSRADKYYKRTDRCLTVKLNPKVSSFKRNIQEAKIDTIGGGYPMFFRNGDMNYIEIGLSGLISYWMDEEGFATSEILEETTNLTIENINAERLFREEVWNWLTDGKPKVYESPTEGIWLVRLMNVTMSPQETLGRMLYTFSCTCYQCGQEV